MYHMSYCWPMVPFCIHTIAVNDLQVEDKTWMSSKPRAVGAHHGRLRLALFVTFPSQAAERSPKYPAQGTNGHTIDDGDRLGECSYAS